MRLWSDHSYRLLICVKQAHRSFVDRALLCLEFDDSLGWNLLQPVCRITPQILHIFIGVIRESSKNRGTRNGLILDNLLTQLRVRFFEFHKILPHFFLKLLDCQAEFSFKKVNYVGQLFYFDLSQSLQFLKSSIFLLEGELDCLLFLLQTLVFELLELGCVLTAKPFQPCFFIV